MTLHDFLKSKDLNRFKLLEFHLGHLIAEKFKKQYSLNAPKISYQIMKLNDYPIEFLEASEGFIVDESRTFCNNLLAQKTKPIEEILEPVSQNVPRETLPKKRTRKPIPIRSVKPQNP